jgi:hypothetical protein
MKEIYDIIDIIIKVKVKDFIDLKSKIWIVIKHNTK